MGGGGESCKINEQQVQVNNEVGSTTGIDGDDNESEINAENELEISPEIEIQCFNC